MPFVSKQQARMAFATGKPWAKKFAEQTDWENLPESAGEGKAIKSVKKKLEAIGKRKD